MKLDINNTLRENTGHKPYTAIHKPYTMAIRTWTPYAPHGSLGPHMLPLSIPLMPNEVHDLYQSYFCSFSLAFLVRILATSLYHEQWYQITTLHWVGFKFSSNNFAFFWKLIFGIIIFRCSLRFVEHVKQLIHFNNLTNLLKRKHHINWLDTDSRNER